MRARMITQMAARRTNSNSLSKIPSRLGSRSIQYANKRTTREISFQCLRMRRVHKHWKEISLVVRLLAYWIERDPSLLGILLRELLLVLLAAICVIILALI